MMPMQTAAFGTLRPPDMGRASAIFNSFRQVTIGFGVALLATVLSNRMIHYGAALGNPLTRSNAVLSFHDAFLAAAVLSAFGLLPALLVSDKEAAPTMRQDAPAVLLE